MKYPCISPPYPLPTPLVGNDEQTCCLPCDDGTNFCTTIAAGTFLERNVATANAFAYSAACFLAAGRRFCIPNIPLSKTVLCVNKQADISLTVAQGVAPLTWTLIGSLPPGLQDSNSEDGRTLFISGVPIMVGNYTFSYLVTDDNGFHITKQFKLRIWGITTVTLPDSASGVFYSVQLNAANGQIPYTFTLTSGALPSQLTLSDTGLISGPADFAPDTTAEFEVTLTDGNHVVCVYELKIHQPASVVPPPPACPGLVDVVLMPDYRCSQLSGCDFRGLLFVTQYNAGNVLSLNQGSLGIAGTSGIGGNADGSCYVPPKKANASSTTLIDDFIVPALYGTVSIHVVSTAWMTLHKVIFFIAPGPAAFQVIAIPDGTHATVKFIGLPGNIVPGTVIPSTNLVFGTMPNTDLVYTCADDALVTIDPDNFSVAVLYGGLLGHPGNGSLFYASVANRVCFGAGGKLYSFDCSTGALAGPAGGFGAIWGYSPASNRAYASAPGGNNTLIAAIDPVSLGQIGANLALASLFHGTGVFCDYNNAMYFGWWNSQDLPQGVDCFDSFTNARLASISLENVNDTTFVPYPGVSSIAFDKVGRRLMAGYGGRVATIDPARQQVICVTLMSAHTSTGRTYFPSFFSTVNGKVYATGLDGASMDIETLY